MERTLTNITDTAPRSSSCWHWSCPDSWITACREVVPGFYRNHKKIWAYQSGEEFFKVTSHPDLP